ncbi:MAG: cell division protein FtsQ, partial [Rickettsiales bacterium]|nr:cell division protein FtsQ [Rickettsiales bacterium]
EREPIALWQNDGEVVLIDTEGKVIEGVDLKKFKDLFLIVGKDAPQHINSLVPLVQSNKKIKSRIKSAIRVGNRRWNVRFANGIEIMLPEENFVKAWQSLLDLHRKKNILADNELSVIDLRIADRITMQRKDHNTSNNSGV